ncbi:MAG: hypothetical protein IJ642_04045 [Oscillospiraceae bacterium]|nr:hypothetical protein [Oscillospiraceae bacterium]
MNLNAVWKGVSIGAAIGSAAFMLVKTTENKKRNIRRDASKTLKSAKNLMDDISSIVM